MAVRPCVKKCHEYQRSICIRISSGNVKYDLSLVRVANPIWNSCHAPREGHCACEFKHSTCRSLGSSSSSPSSDDGAGSPQSAADARPGCASRRPPLPIYGDTMPWYKFLIFKIFSIFFLFLPFVGMLFLKSLKNIKERRGRQINDDFWNTGAMIWKF